MLPVSREEAMAHGLKRYFTGKPCKRGHIAERQIANFHCLECTAEKKRRWRASNLEESRRRTREYKDEHPEWVKERAKARYDRNPSHIQAINKKWLDKNPELRTAYLQQWRADNPDMVRATRHRRRARVANSSENYTASDVREIRAAQKGKCAICSIHLVKYHIDHIIPLMRGGDNSRRNIQLLCPTCNVRKSFRDPIDYMRSVGRLL